MDLDFSIIKPHEEAAAIIANKPALPKHVFDALLPELKARAFTVTGIEDADVLQRVRDAIAEVPRGLRWDDAKANISAELDPWLGDNADSRAELLLRTQTFTAFQTQTWRQAQADDDTTHLQYMTMEDDRVRDTHAALDGLVLPKDDEFWNRHYPPWEWNCRCQVRTMNPDQVDEERKADEDRAPDNQMVMHGAALVKLREGHLIREGRAYNVMPDERGDGFSWHPEDLTIPLHVLRDRYDSETFNQFERAMKQIELAGGVTVWDWLNAKDKGESGS
jgi:SPP1 gp7 family putative phage head morphogenesis protein